ncbi:MAG TPA: hypothetical protein VGR56_08605 [Nitrososphaerales archaeon]|nr:hypothetical protein [Nitrososphaerales archaeon]
MNRDLFGFAILLVLLGIGFGIYLISFVGLLLMIPAFLARPRQKTGTNPPPIRQQTRRISPPPVRQAEPWVTTAKPVATPPVPTPEPTSSTSTPTFGVPIFPTSMFPPLSITSAPPTLDAAPPLKSAQGDELLEIGAILALLRFAFG